MRPDPRDEGGRWLDQAARDLDDAAYNRDGGRHNVACFLAQQAAEKALKGFLFFHGAEVVREHAVSDLCERAAGVDPRFREITGDCAHLDVYYIPTRYPDGLPGGLPSSAFGPPDSERALALGRKVIDTVRAALPRD